MAASSFPSIALRFDVLQRVYRFSFLSSSARPEYDETFVPMLRRPMLLAKGFLSHFDE
jgi:hypothetical protein